MPLENADGLQRIVSRLDGLAGVDQADVEPLLEEWEKVIVEDNRKGVLEGTDRHGNPMTPVTYRGQAAARKVRARSGDFFGSSLKGERARKVRELRAKGVRHFGVDPKGVSKVPGGALRAKGISSYTFTNAKGQAVILANNNLSTREYRKLDGPPTAPRGPASRVISNLVTSHGRDGDEYFAVGSWEEVVSPKGVKFLMAHFTGERNLPVRDLRGVRPWGVAKARAALREWATLLLGGRS